MKPFRSVILAATLLTSFGAAHARDGIDDITMRVMEDIVKEDKAHGARILELPISPARARELQERSRERSQQGDKERKKEKHGESERHTSEQQGKERKEHRDDERSSRHDEQYDERDSASDDREEDRNSSIDERNDDRNSVVEEPREESETREDVTDSFSSEEALSDDRDAEPPAVDEAPDEEAVDHN